MNVEQELRRALRRPEAPAGFAERVMERIASERRSSAAERRRTWRGLRAAAAITIVMLGGWEIYQVEQNRRAERAAQDAIAALRVTSEKINLAKAEIDRHSAD